MGKGFEGLWVKVRSGQGVGSQKEGLWGQELRSGVGQCVPECRSTELWGHSITLGSLS